MEAVGEEEESGLGACLARELDSNLSLAASNCEALGESSNGQVFVFSSTDIQTVTRARLGESGAKHRAGGLTQPGPGQCTVCATSPVGPKSRQGKLKV